MTRRFTSELLPIIGPQKDIPAPDMATNEQTMAWMMDTYSMEIGHAVPEIVTGKPISLGGSLFRHEATGAGVVMVIERACRAARVGSRRAALRRPGVRQRRWDRRGRARRQGRVGDRGLGRLRRRARRGRARRPGAAALRRGARVARRLGRGRPAHERGAARAALRHPRPGGARGPDPRRQRAPAAGAPDRRGRERADLAGGRRDPRRARDPGAARRAHERGRRDGLVLRVGAGSRPPLLGSRGDSSASSRNSSATPSTASGRSASRRT